MTHEQIKNRITQRMRDYYRANVSPVSVPDRVQGTSWLPTKTDASTLCADQHTQSREKLIINLNTIKQHLSKVEKETVRYRLMGYTIQETARFLTVSPETVKKYLSRIHAVCREVHNA